MILAPEAESDATPALSAKQVYSIGAAIGRVNLWEGAVRSGKTFGSIIAWLNYVARASKKGQLVMVGRSRDSIYRNVFAPLEQDPAFAAFAPYVRYRQGAPTATIFGRKVHVMGADDARSEAKIRGMTVAGAYLDELTVLSMDFFKQMLARMSVAGARLFATTNPDGPNHWLKREYLNRLAELPDWRVFHFTMDDNPSLSPEYKAALRREYTGLWFKRFILGLWVSAEGAIYQEWDEDRHVIDWEQLPPIRDYLAIGMDYGTTNPSSGILLGITDEVDEHGRPTPRLVAIDEWRYDPSKTGERLTDVRLSELYRSWLRRDHVPDQLDEWSARLTVLDPAAASFGEQLAADGIATWKADNSVADGIADVANLLGTGRLIVTDRCTGLIAEAPGYVWDEKATKHGEDKPVKENDHSLDALRYAVRTSKAYWQPIMAAAYGLAA